MVEDRSNEMENDDQDCCSDEREHFHCCCSDRHRWIFKMLFGFALGLGIAMLVKHLKNSRIERQSCGREPSEPLAASGGI